MPVMAWSQEYAGTDSVESSFSIGGDWFMAYQKFVPNRNNDAFKLKRGYLTFKKQFSDVYSARYTQDITIDNEGDDAGNVELRFKYCYLKTRIPSFAFFSHSYIEAGLVHRPWIDFEEHINKYRVQSKMFLEKTGIINSADFGLTFISMLGGRIDREYQRSVNEAFPGKYGSVAIGVYNGGGYHALEINNNKTIEGRLTLRPFPENLPGLQTSYSMAYGKGNDTLISDFQVNLFFLSYETRFAVLTAQYYFGKGNKCGNNELRNDGYSFFGEFLIPKTDFTLFSRYDHFHTEEEPSCNNIIAGVAYYFYRDNKILFDFDRISRENGGTDRIYEIALEIRF